jgi:hypothetical protein
LVLPVQFSNCWEIETSGDTPPPRIVRANIVQTGVLFKGQGGCKAVLQF